MLYRFIIKQSQAKNSKKLFVSAWIECDCLEQAIAVKDAYLADKSEYYGLYLRWERK
jgi:hypothetical protein